MHGQGHASMPTSLEEGRGLSRAGEASRARFFHADAADRVDRVGKSGEVLRCGKFTSRPRSPSPRWYSAAMNSVPPSLAAAA